MLRTRETQNNSFLCFMLSCFLRSAIKRGQTRAKHRDQLLIPSRKLVPVRSHKQQTLHSTLGRVWIVEHIVIHHDGG